MTENDSEKQATVIRRAKPRYQHTVCSPDAAENHVKQQKSAALTNATDR